MKWKLLLLCTVTFLVPMSAAAQEKPGPELMTYERFLEIHQLNAADLECRNQRIETVRNPRTGERDLQREVCEIWKKEKVIPAEPVTFKDGTQAYRTFKVWTELVPEPKPVERKMVLVVRGDEETLPKEPEVNDYKRYVVEKP